MHHIRTLADVYGPGHVYCPRASFTVPGWLPRNASTLDLVTGGQLTIAGAMPVLCSAGVATDEAQRLLADAGLAVTAPLLRYAGADEYAAVLEALVRTGTRLVCQHVHPAAEVPEASTWIPPRVLRFLNNKGNLGALVPEALVPARRLVRLADVARGAGEAGDDATSAALARRPVVLKAASDLSSAAGGGVWICRDDADLVRASRELAGVEAVVVEELLPIERSVCLHFVVAIDGDIRYLGAAEQVVDAAGRWQGNWITNEAAPSAAVAAGYEIMRRAVLRGYIGFAGFDVACCADGRLRVLDLNFRVNGSMTAVFLRGEMSRLRAVGAMRLRTWRGSGDFASLIAAAGDAVAAGTLVPLAVYDPVRGKTDGPPLLAGLLLGDARDEVARREADLARRGLV